jgi:hypothetical protein
VRVAKVACYRKGDVVSKGVHLSACDVMGWMSSTGYWAEQFGSAGETTGQNTGERDHAWRMVDAYRHQGVTACHSLKSDAHCSHGGPPPSQPWGQSSCS